MKVFLGGTVNGSTWREYVMPRLEIDYFNPVVPDWNDEAYKRELFERQNCAFCLYVLTPKMEGFYSIAEVVDDSFKKPDRTLFCFIENDEAFTFTPEQDASLQHLGQMVLANGGAWYHSLDEVIKVLNSSKAQKEGFKSNDQYNNFFISYGRRHSLDFARKLYNRLTAESFGVWFDMNDIPLGVDFQEQIDRGIEKADNFIFIISPHSVKSIYCRKEIELAVKYNKRIIPLLHVYPSDCEDKMHPVIARLNWIYFQEDKNDFEPSFNGLVELANTHKAYVRLHSVLLHKALEWEKRKYLADYLLFDSERLTAQKWLLIRDFFDKKGLPTQAPCFPTDLQAIYISESKANAELSMNDIFISFADENKPFKDRLALSLAQHALSTWIRDEDIKSGTDFDKAVEEGMERADNFVCIISKASIKSDICKMELALAIKLNKRIIPILLERIDAESTPADIRSLQYIDFTHIEEKQQLTQVTYDNVKDEVEQRKSLSYYDKRVAELINEISKDNLYYRLHKEFLVRALTWMRQNYQASLLLTGFQLEQAKTWLKFAVQNTYKPIHIQEKIIAESDAKASAVTYDVFICYSTADSDFARKLNVNLLLTGKNTWYDLEYIPDGTDSKTEIQDGIRKSETFLFIVSSDSVLSPKRLAEIKHARLYNKRIIGVLSKDIDEKSLPAQIQNIQTIDFSRKGFLVALSELIRALDFDREHIQGLNKWSQQAVEWDLSNRSGDQLIRGIELELVKKWFSEATEKNKRPAPSPLLIEFIDASKKALLAAERAKKRWAILLRLLMIVMGFLLIMAIISFFVAKKERDKAKESEKAAIYNSEIARKQKLVADSIADVAQQNAHEARINAEKARLKEEEAMRNAKMVESQNIELIQGKEELKRQHKSIEKANSLLETQRDTLKKNLEKLNTQTTTIFDLLTKNRRNHLLALSRTMSMKAMQYLYDEKLQKATQYALYAHFLNRKEKGFMQNSDNYDALKRCLDAQINKNENSVFALHQFPVRAIDMNPTNNMVASGDDGGDVFLWSANPTIELKAKISLKDRIRALKFSSNNRYLAAGTFTGFIKIWDVSSPEKPKELTRLNLQLPIKSFAFISNAKEMYLIITTAKLFKIVKIVENRLVEPLFEMSFQNVYSMNVSNDGSLLIVGLQDEIQVFNIDFSTKSLVSVKNYPIENGGRISAIALDNSKTKIAVGNNKGNLWLISMIMKENNTCELSIIEKFTEHLSEITDLKFNAASTQLASSSLDRNARLWNLNDLKEDRIVLYSDNKWIWSITYGNSDKRLFTAYEDKKVRIWYTYSDDLASELCKTRPLHFSQEEWEQITDLENKDNKNLVPEICK